MAQCRATYIIIAVKMSRERAIPRNPVLIIQAPTTLDCRGSGRAQSSESHGVWFPFQVAKV